MVTLGCLQAGCRMVLMGKFDPDHALQLIESERASIILGVPTMIMALLEAQEASPRDVSSLQLVSCGGSMVAPELIRRVYGSFRLFILHPLRTDRILSGNHPASQPRPIR